MRNVLVNLSLCALVGFWTMPTSAQVNSNLQTCLSGRVPALCQHDLLTPDQAAAVQQAELAQNYNVCLTGRYPALCRHDLLTGPQIESVSEAEHRANYAVCIQGRYSALCNHVWLSAAEKSEVTKAERQENYRTCLSGVTPFICRHQDLTAEQTVAVHDAEHRVNQRNCASPTMQFNCRRDWLAEDTQAATPPTTAPSPSLAPVPAPVSITTAVNPSTPAASISAPQIGLASSPSNAHPDVTRCQAFWVGAVAADGKYLYLSDYAKLTPVAASDAQILAEWRRGQHVVRCGQRLTNKDAGQTIAVMD
ncbi:YARHG domain-containing protein [Pararobbsia alpina]